MSNVKISHLKQINATTSHSHLIRSHLPSTCIEVANPIVKQGQRVVGGVLPPT